MKREYQHHRVSDEDLPALMTTINTEQWRIHYVNVAFVDTVLTYDIFVYRDYSG